MAGEGNSSGARATRVLFFGAPGSGKGTQAALLAERLHVPAISTGEMLRQAVAGGTSLGKKCETIMTTGALVDDVTMADVVRDRLAQADAREGFILDGYPRNIEQADTLEVLLRQQGAEVGAAIFLDVPEEELVRRMTGRREQVGRADDREEIVRERLRIYREKTAPLVEFYRQRGVLRRIDGNQPVEAVTQAIVAALDADAEPSSARRAG